MDIKIIKQIDDTYITESLIKWKSSAKHNIRMIYTFFGLALFYLIIGVTKQNRHDTFWNFWTSLGIAFVIVAMLLILHVYTEKSKFISKAKDCINKSKTTDVTIEYIFSDEEISVRDSESYGEFKWSLFSEYQLHQNYLLIYLKNAQISVIEVDIKKITGDQFNSLLTLISSKLANRA